MEDCDEDSIPVVTITLPSRRLSTSPKTLLVRSSSLVQLMQNSSSPPLTLTHVENPCDNLEMNNHFSSSNALNNNKIASNSLNSNNLNSTLRYSQSEINLVKLMELPSATLNNDSKEKDTSLVLLNSSISKSRNHFDVNNATLSASLNNNFFSDKKEDIEKADEKDKNKKQSLWTRIQSTICCRSLRTKDKSSPTTSYHHKPRRPRLSRLLYYLRVFLTHLFSTTGLCFLVVAYSGLGAVIFTHLESGHEFAVKASLEDERLRTATELWNYTMMLNVLNEKFWMDEVVRRIGEFEEKVVKTMLTEGYGATVEQWSFSGALLYSVTVITTIGYGNVTCKTDWGRIATILYAIIGIPITFLCLANLGNLMAKAFRFSYRKICCCECFCPSKTAKLRKRIHSQRSQSASRSASHRSKQRNRQNKTAAAEFGEPSPVATSTAIGTPAFHLPHQTSTTPPVTPGASVEPPAYFENIYNVDAGQPHSIVLFNSTADDPLSSKRLSASIDLQRSHSLQHRSPVISQGPPSPALTVVTVKSAATADGGQSSIRTELLSKVPKSKTEDFKSAFDDDNNDDDDDDVSSLSDIDLDQEELDALEDEDRVPISLVFLLVLGYIILGAFMFSIWEQWGPIEGAYFCFTTLTTIGFGDLVPGSAKFSQDKDGQTKFIMCCVYMMCGLALIAMSFNLVQEEIVIKCRRIARRLGIMPTKKEHKRFSAENKRRFKALWAKHQQEKADII